MQTIITILGEASILLSSPVAAVVVLIAGLYIGNSLSNWFTSKGGKLIPDQK